MVHIWGVLGPHCRVNKWSTSFRSIKIGVTEDFLEPSFQRGVQSFRCFLVFWSENRLYFCSGACCFMLLLDYKKGSDKKKL